MGLMLGALTVTAPVHAQSSFKYTGILENDIRFSLPGKEEPGGVPEVRFLRTDSTAKYRANFTSGTVRAVGDVSVVFTGIPQAENIEGLTVREQVDPFRLESEALFLEIDEFLAEGLSLKMGREILRWGTGFMFNPTNVVNAYDFEDPLKFGDVIATEMVVLSYTAPWSSYSEEMDLTLFDEFTLTFVAVPVFRPAQLPQSSLVAFTDPALFNQLVSSPTIDALIGLQQAFEGGGGQIAYDVATESPNLGLENMALAGRMSWTMLGTDVSFTYYRGHDDTPRAETIAVSDLPIPVTNEDLEDIDGLLNTIKSLALDGVVAQTDVILTWPRVHVFGADFATSLDSLGGVGLWGEFAWTVHEDLRRFIRIGDAQVLEEEAEQGGFWKLTAGLDYAITSWWYANIQYLHGFVDEFGADNLHDYLVGGSNFTFLANTLTFRMFSIVQLQDLSTVIYPQIILQPWANTEVTAGAFVFVGEDDSKFGSRITGPSTFFFKGRYSF